MQTLNYFYILISLRLQPTLNRTRNFDSSSSSSSRGGGGGSSSINISSSSSGSNRKCNDEKVKVHLCLVARS